MNVFCKKTKSNKVACKAYNNVLTTEPNWEFVKKYLPLVKLIVDKWVMHLPPTIDKEGLYAVGLLGLISATQMFKPALHCPFKVYATIRIRGSLVDELRRMDVIPRGFRSKAKEFYERVQQLQVQLNRDVSDEEICMHLGVSKRYCRYMRELFDNQMHFVPLLGNDDENIVDRSYLLDDCCQRHSRDIIENREIYQNLKRFLYELPKLQQQLLTLYYVHDLNLKEIAPLLQISASRASQLHLEAIEKLRKKFLSN